ncbi:MAG TPA: hypothetical protein PLB50_05870, partial [Candidatus Saccharicenans sp.]|nr:hypothetical protein [Candidatus Saccharicenans sp.]
MRVKRLKIISGVFLILIFVLVLTAFKGNDHSTRWQPGLDSLKKVSSGEASLELAGITLPFVANEGQWAGHIKYQAGLFSGKFLVTEHELVYSLPIANHPGDKRLIADPEMPGDEKPFHDSELTRNETTDRLLPVTLRESFLTTTGSLAALSPFGQEKSSSRISYFEGNDPDKWRSGLASYSSLSLGAIYPGIEVELKASGQNVEKLFYL